MNYEIVKLYFVDPDFGWQTKTPPSGVEYVEGYFIKVDGKYFNIGLPGESYYVDESK